MWKGYSHRSPMEYNSNLVRALYLLTLLAQVAVAWGVFHRELQRQVRWFTAFLVFSILESLCAYPLYEIASANGIHAKALYTDVTWLLESFGQILVLLFIFEIIRKELVAFPGARRVITRILTVAVVLFLVIAFGIMPFAHAGHPVTRLVNVSIRSVRLFQVGLIVSFFLLVRGLSLHLRNYQFGILLGFGLYAASALAESALVSEYGGDVAYKAMLIDAFSAIGMYLIWLYYILKRDPVAPAEPPAMGREDLERWKKSLDHVRRKKSSLP